MEESKIVSTIKTNPKVFYSYANKRLKTRTAVGPIQTDSGLLTAPQEIAAALSDQYKSVFTTPLQPNLLISPVGIFGQVTDPPVCDFSDIPFTLKDVEEALESLKPSSAPGEDAIPSALLKKCSKQLAKPLHRLFRHCLNTGQPLEEPYKSQVKPLFKGGNRSDPKQYRPIALTSNVTKVMEKIIKKYLVSYLEQGSHIPPSQHGFLPNRSTVTQLLEFHDNIIKSLDNGEDVATIYLDYAKAFDKCDHSLLLTILCKTGIGGKIGHFIFHFLTNRYQSVLANGASSPATKVASGVPQGSVLGPVLFLILVKDLPKACAHSAVHSYADDTKLSKSLNSITDQQQLQQDLLNVADWSTESNLQLHYSKFQYILFSLQPSNSTASFQSPSNDLIPSSTSVRDLGVIFQQDAKFTNHIQSIVTRAYQMSGWVFRTFHSRSKDLMVTLYKQLVRCHLEYASPLWSPTDVASLTTIEKVQRNFTRQIEGMSGRQRPSYWDRLRLLNLSSLERRMERYKILTLYKILHGLVPNPNIQWQYNERRGFTINLPKANSTTSEPRRLIENSFGYHAGRVFNCLPPSLRMLDANPSLANFKARLDTFLNKIPDEPSIPGLTRRAKSNSIIDQIFYFNQIYTPLLH